MTATPDTTRSGHDVFSAADSPQDIASAPIPMVPRAVLAVPLPERGWAGRILTHAPGPAATARILQEILRTRHTGRDRAARAISELIYQHPAGWEHLGTDPANPPTRTRKRKVELGRCRCHLPDSTARPALARAQQDALTSAEFGQPHRVEPAPGHDGAPWLITHRHSLDEDVAHLFLLHPGHINIFARDQSDQDHLTEVAIRGFSHVARIPTSRPTNWESFAPELDAASAAIRARPRRDWKREAAARTLAETATRLQRVAAHVDLVLYLLGGVNTASGQPDPLAEAALAAAANVHGADLPALLLRSDRADQIRLLKLAAHHLAPDKHHAP